MIKIKCTAPMSVKLSELKPFQGNLKKRTDEDIAALAKSIEEEGLLMPFAIWNEYILDGHGRLAALRKLNVDEDMELPAIIIDAADETAARKALLQITSSYGKVTKKGAIEFCASIPQYNAPAVSKFIHTPVKHRKLEEQKTESIIRISVPTDKMADVIDILKSVSYIRVL